MQLNDALIESYAGRNSRANESRPTRRHIKKRRNPVNDRNLLFRHGSEKVKNCRERPRGARLQGPPATTGVANWPGRRVSGRTISDNGLLCQLEVGFQAGLDTGSRRGED